MSLYDAHSSKINLQKVNSILTLSPKALDLYVRELSQADWEAAQVLKKTDIFSMES